MELSTFDMYTALLIITIKRLEFHVAFINYAFFNFKLSFQSLL